MGILRDSRGNSVRDSNDREIRTGSSDRDSSSRSSSDRSSSSRESSSRESSSRDSSSRGSSDKGSSSRESSSRESFSAGDRSSSGKPRETIESITRDMDAKMAREKDRVLHRDKETTIERAQREEKESFEKTSFSAGDRSNFGKESRETIESITRDMDAKLAKEVEHVLHRDKETTTTNNLEKQELGTHQTVMEKLNHIMVAKGQTYGTDKIIDYAKGKLQDGAFFFAKLATSPVPPANMAVRGVEKICDFYDKVDKTEELNLINSIKDDIKQIDLNQHSPEETGYEFVKLVQYQPSEEEIKAFYDRVDLCADTIQEGY